MDLPEDAGPGTYRVALDQGLLEHAILNIALNARDAIAEDGTIVFRVRREALHGNGIPGLKLEITDDGKGMSPEVLRRATDPYFSTKALKHGSGIGLSVVRDTMEQVGGDLDLESTPGAGTTVRLVFTEAEPQEPEAEQQTTKRIRLGRGERVLIVEDDPDVLTLMCAMLRRLDYEPVSATSAAGAWKMVSDGLSVDAVVTDIDMPGGLDGDELARRLEAHDPALPVLLISGYDLAAIAAAGWHAPRGFRQKPIGLPVLSEELAALLGARHREDLRIA